MKILFAASEAKPFAATGGLADVIGSLPKEIANEGNDVRVVIPLYKQIKQVYRKQMKYETSMDIKVGWRTQYCEVFSLNFGGVIFYFIDSHYYFARDGLYGFDDDIERFTFFSSAVLELIRAVKFSPNVINCNDWQTALIPVYYQLFYKYRDGYEDIKTVFTVHNIQYQGIFGTDLLYDLTGIPEYYQNILEYDGCINLMKGAFETCDKISTVSDTYSKEILQPWFSYGMDRILINKTEKIVGIINGIDTKSYDPETDIKIPYNYNADDFENKAKCKNFLREKCNLEENDKPLVAIISRLVAHKGMSLVRLIFEDAVRSGMQFVILGTGEKSYEDFFKEMADRYKKDVSCNIKFDSDFARQIYAGADIFLMPSENEPCGLAQMIAMRYGTIPLVRETGGLRDTVIDFKEDSLGNGFSFKNQNAAELMKKLNEAVDTYYNKAEWGKLIKNAMNSDFGWGVSAKKYIYMYKNI